MGASSGAARRPGEKRTGRPDGPVSAVAGRDLASTAMSTRAALVAVEPAALTRRFPDDGFLRWELAAGRSAAEGGAAEGGAAAWVLAGAWAQAKTVDGRSRVVAGGDPADAADLLAALVPARVVPERLSVVREAVGLLRPDLAPVGGDDWDWFATTRAPTPRLPGEDRAVRADVADPVVLGAVLELLDGHSPRYSRDPRGSGATWWAIPDTSGEAGSEPGLAAVTAAESLPHAVHLASIATRTDLRGQGLGSALTAAVTRAALANGAEAVVLGMYSDNDTARRMYRRLGFVDTHRWRSGRPAGYPVPGFSPLEPPGQRPGRAAP